MTRRTTKQRAIITIEAGTSADPNVNAALSNALKKAKTSGLPKENIEKAITRVRFCCLFDSGAR